MSNMVGDPTSAFRAGCVVQVAPVCLRHDGRAIVAGLARAHRRLLHHPNGKLDLQSDAGGRAGAMFLHHLSVAAERLCCEVADRSYRKSFAKNYQLLFPDTKRNYRTDVLEACIEQQDSFFVNGAQYRLTDQIHELGAALRLAWHGLGRCLGREHEDLGEVVAAMAALDVAWARFEHRYILELMGIEEEARGILAAASALERRLRREEREYGRTSRKARKARRRLAACAAKLNSVANAGRKGRDDLGAEVLERAFEALGGPADARQTVARRVLASFQGLRAYLRQAGAFLERIDPYLSNNPGLSARLANWEEAWEVGRLYLGTPLGSALSDAASSLMRAGESVPAFAAMCEGRDPELFLVLPRVLWLSFLRRPTEQAALMRSVLSGPHDAEALDAFAEAHCCLDARLCEALGDEAAASELLRRAVGVEPQTDLPPPEREAVARFMQELERWSMTLQRSCPEDWNACAAVILSVLAPSAEP